MKFDFDKPVNRRGTDSVKWDEANNDVLPLWIADMDFETAPCVHEAILRRAQHGVFGYSLVPESFYESIIWWNDHRHGWKPRRDWILYTSGVVPAVSAVIKGLCPAGSSVSTFIPAYNCFFSSIRNNDCRLVESPLVWSAHKESYSIDFELFERQIVEEKVCLFLLCNPHNPSGRVWTYEELHTIAQICARHHVIVLSDEIHCEFVNPQLGRSYLPFAPIADEVNCQWVVVNAPNKAFNIAGLQTAYIISSSEEFRKRIDKAININEVCDINVFSFVALQAAYTAEGEEWLNQLVNYIYENYRLFRQGVKVQMPDLPIAHLEGTYLAWMDVRPYVDSSSELADKLLRERKLWINAGDMYGQSGFMRINLATQRSNIEEMLHRLLPLP